MAFDYLQTGILGVLTKNIPGGLEMKKAAIILGFVCMMIIVAGFVAVPDGYAGSKVVKVEGAIFSINDTMAENIARYKGKPVTVVLSSGEQINGIVVDANGGFLHLEKLNREEFLDSLISMEHVIAVKAQFRQYER